MNRRSVIQAICAFPFASLLPWRHEKRVITGSQCVPKTIWVDFLDGSDTQGGGSQRYPLKTIEFAMRRINSSGPRWTSMRQVRGKGKRVCIRVCAYVSPGILKEIG